MRNLLLTGSLFSGPLFLVFCFNNTVAIGYRSTQALPFGTIVIIAIIWALVTFPLTVSISPDVLILHTLFIWPWPFVSDVELYLSSICVQVLGGIAGKNNKSEFYAPCRTNKYPREIPALPWYRKTVPQVFDSLWDLSTYVLGSHYLPFCEPSGRGKSWKNVKVGKIPKF